ncbi:hypothetical protein A6U91_06260 [Agrobacterium tumefaciens]|uniref:ATP-binding protein n=2 Tax=Agrobacterium tumefaciens TaxID=358 RepID=A0AB36EJ80_AGRTU|nr:hypothetical protein A6U91_06260 [Agrobacterium tumefaciens]
MSLKQINLIVGRNASGKSRTLNVMYALARTLSGKQAPTDGHFVANFLHDEQHWRYELNVENAVVVTERLDRENEVLLERARDGTGKIYAAQLATRMAFQAPPNTLAASTRVDAIQHPYLQPLVDWANEFFYYPCHTELGKHVISIFVTSGQQPDIKDWNQIVHVYRQGEKLFGGRFRASIISDMKEIGYDLTDLGLSQPTTIQVQAGQGDILSLFVREEGVNALIDQFSMSIGMFRALAIIIHLNYGLYSGEAGTIAIDDIGEGLDFDRSSNLIGLVINKINRSKTQLIMTTNDRYVMNGVNLAYWSVLLRKGNEVFVMNPENNKDIFDEFRFTGLSNFDFLAQNFAAGVNH